MMKMKKEVKHLGISTSLVLMVMVLFGSLFSSCYTKDDVPVIPPTESTDPATYVVNIAVMDADGPVAGVKFYGMSTLKEVSSGNYVYTQTGAGDATFVLSKEGYEDASYTVTLPTAKNGENVTLAATFFMKKEKVEAAATYTVSGLIYDPIDGAQIANVKVLVALRGETPKSLEVKDDRFSYTTETPGIYEFIFSGDGMETMYYSITIQKIPAGQEFLYDVLVPLYKEGTVEGKTYTLSGTITGENGVSLNNVTMIYRNNDGEEIKSVINGNFLISNLLSGNVTIYFQAKDYNGLERIYDLKQFPVGTIVDLPIVLQKLATGTGSSTASGVVTPEQKATIVVPVLAETSTTVSVESSLDVPAGALASTMLIQSTVSGGLEEAVVGTISTKTAAAAAFTTGVFLPEGLKFGKPVSWSVKNPFNAELGNVKLQYSADGSAWAYAENENVVLSQGNYVGSVLHFSSYRMALEASEVKVDTMGLSVALTLEPFYINKAAKNLKKGEGVFTYTAKEGFEYTTNATQALTAAGIAVEDKLVDLIEQGIKKINGVQLKDKEYKATNVVDIPSDYVYVATGTQKFVTITYTFRVDNKDVKVVVRVAKETILTGKIEMYDQHHHHAHGGHITDGGAGGGAGE